MLRWHSSQGEGGNKSHSGYTPGEIAAVIIPKRRNSKRARASEGFFNFIIPLVFYLFVYAVSSFFITRFLWLSSRLPAVSLFNCSFFSRMVYGLSWLMLLDAVSLNSLILYLFKSFKQYFFFFLFSDELLCFFCNFYFSHIYTAIVILIYYMIDT